MRSPYILKALLLTTVALLHVGRSFIPWRKIRTRPSNLERLYISNETAVHEHFMKMAILQARRAEKRGEVPIGAIVVQQNGVGGPVVLSGAHNLVETQYDASSHAELLALRQAAKKVKNWRLVNTTLYTTLEPCPMCLSAAQAFRVSSIVYGAPDLRLGAIQTHIRLLDIRHPMHSIGEVIPGILENESATMMRSFFRQRRQKKDVSPLKRSAVFRAKIKKLLRKE
jgi:tRNA(adenine34) deaminase